MNRMMIKVLISLFSISMMIGLVSCGNKPKEQSGLVPFEIIGSPYKAEAVVALELGWGNGGYEVGYVEEGNEIEAKEGYVEPGPCEICVDGQGSFYISDSKNRRYLKYDKDGGLVGAISWEGIGYSKGPINMYGGLDCVFFHKYETDVFLKYSFEKDELKEAKLSEFGINSKIDTLDLLYDGIGDVYFRDLVLRSQYPELGDEATDAYYVINEAFDQIIDRIETPGDLALAFHADAGNLYSTGKLEPEQEKAGLYRMNNQGVTLIAPVAIYDNSSVPASADDVFFCTGGFELGGCNFFNKNGEIIEEIETPRYKHIKSPSITRGGDVYFIQHRQYVPNDDDPFRIYKLQIRWGEES